MIVRIASAVINRPFLCFAGFIVFGICLTALLSTLKLWQAKTAKSAEQSAAIERRNVTQRACYEVPFKEYIASKLDLNLKVPMSVEATIAERRLEEQFCLRISQCITVGEPSLKPLVLSATFSSCLRDEALEKYEAVAR